MPPSTEEQAQRIQRMLESLFPGAVERIPAVPAFEVSPTISENATRILVTLHPMDEHEFLVRTNAWIGSIVELSLDLCILLLRRNAVSDLGSFCLSDDQLVGFAHGILGSSIDLNELRSSVLAVATVIDREEELLAHKDFRPLIPRAGDER